MTTEYVDKYGRYHVKPVTDSNPFPTNNAYIYSFYAKMVGLPVTFSEEVLNDIVNIDLRPISRHPGGYHVPVSFDEYVGLAGLDEMTADDIVFYGENNHFQYCDIKGFKPTPFRKLVINDVLSAYEDLANDPEPNPRKAIIKYPVLYPIGFFHRWEQQYFYYRCADRSPGAFRTLYFVVATLVSILRKEKKSPMLGFKFLKLRQLSPSPIEKGLIKLFDRYGDWENVCKKYFPVDHPILEKVLSGS